MCKKIIILVLLIFIVIVLIKILKKRENYDGQAPGPADQCRYDASNTVDYIDCVQRCSEKENCDIDSCVKICKEDRDKDVEYDDNGSIICNVDDSEITGTNITDCIERCQKNGDLGCKVYKNNKPGNEQHEFVWINSIDDYNEKCSAEVATGADYLANIDNVDFKSCSPCVIKCLNCKDHGKCPWVNCGGVGQPLCIDSSVGITQQDIDSIKLTIYAIPNSNQITVFWNITGFKHAFEKFILMYSPKVSTTNEHPPVKWKEINYNPNPDVENSVIVTGLLNDVKYNFVINGIIKRNNDISIIHSNTIEATPSEPNVINFTGNNCNSIKTVKSSSENLLNNFLGKTFEISL